MYSRLLPIYQLLNQFEEACRESPYASEAKALLNEYNTILKAYDAQNFNRQEDQQKLKLAYQLENSQTKEVIQHKDIVNLQMNNIQEVIRNNQSVATVQKQMEEKKKADIEDKEAKLQQLLNQIKERKQQMQQSEVQKNQDVINHLQTLQQSLQQSTASGMHGSHSSGPQNRSFSMANDEMVQILNDENIKLKKELTELKCQLINQNISPENGTETLLKTKDDEIAKLKAEIMNQKQLISDIYQLMTEQQDELRTLEEANISLKQQILVQQ